MIYNDSIRAIRKQEASKPARKPLSAAAVTPEIIREAALTGKTIQEVINKAKQDNLNKAKRGV